MALLFGKGKEGGEKSPPFRSECWEEDPYWINVLVNYARLVCKKERRAWQNYLRRPRMKDSELEDKLAKLELGDLLLVEKFIDFLLESEPEEGDLTNDTSL